MNVNLLDGVLSRRKVGVEKIALTKINRTFTTRVLTCNATIVVTEFYTVVRVTRAASDRTKRSRTISNGVTLTNRDLGELLLDRWCGWRHSAWRQITIIEETIVIGTGLAFARTARARFVSVAKARADGRTSIQQSRKQVRHAGLAACCSTSHAKFEAMIKGSLVSGAVVLSFRGVSTKDENNENTRMSTKGEDLHRYTSTVESFVRQSQMLETTAWCKDPLSLECITRFAW